METVAATTTRQSNPVSVMTPIADAAHMLPVTATYLLSENGRKASLLNGGDGHAVQQITLQVPGNRLHLVSVDKQGVARLKLRPRFELDSDRGILRIDAAPIYDAPPTVDELYRAAAKNHELETAYYAQRTTEGAKRRELNRLLRESVAEAFLADKERRAVAHPPPSPKRCYIVTDRGRLVFDVVTDQGLAKEVPLEAHRRFRADLRARQERNRHERAAQLALHEEKKRFIAEWVDAHGMDEQKLRQSAGVLPMDEAIEAITDQIFAVAGEFPLYTRDGAERLQAHLRDSVGLADAVVTSRDVAIRSVNVVKATAAQWAMVRELQARFPEARVHLREHVLSSRSRSDLPTMTVRGVLVTLRHGPFMLRREYMTCATDGSDPRAPSATVQSPT